MDNEKSPVCMFCGQPLTEITNEDDVKRGMRGFQCSGAAGVHRYYQPLESEDWNAVMERMMGLL